MNMFGNRVPDLLSLAALISLTLLGVLTGVFIRVHFYHIPAGVSFSRNVGVAAEAATGGIYIWSIAPTEVVSTQEWRWIGFRYVAKPITVGACRYWIVPFWFLFGVLSILPIWDAARSRWSRARRISASDT
jgi:hypothetical protein